MWYLLDDLGFISLFLGIFYFVAMPVMLFKLKARVKVLEERGLSAAPPVSSRKRPTVSVGGDPKGVPALYSDIPQPTATIRVAKKEVGHRSFEERVGGNWFQWIGIAALVLALLFFLKWSFDNGIIGPTGRTIIGYILAAGAIAAGDRLRTKYGIWSLAFTGGGALGSYIITWVALHTYQLFPEPIAFVIYILTTVVICLLAGYYGAISLAAFGIIGGFITPVLVGGGGDTFSLLLYILILDVGIVALGHMRQWRTLNALGLIGTAIYEIIAWGDSSFARPHALAFIAAFMCIYLCVSCYYNLIKQQKSNREDLAILLGNAILHFSLILLWMERAPEIRETYDAVVAIVFAAFFLLFSSELYRRNKNDTPLVLGSLSLTVLFTTIAVPLQLGDAWVPLAWSVEGAFLLWIALTLRDVRIQRFAWLVMAAAYYWYFFVPTGSGNIVHLPTGFFIYLLWTLLFVSLAGLGLPRSDRQEQQVLPFVFVGFVVLTLALGGNMVGDQGLSGFMRFLQAAVLIGGSYAVLFFARANWSTLSANEKSMFTMLGIGTQIVTLSYLTGELVRAVDDQRIAISHQALQVGISILWALYGLATLIVGIVKQWKPLRLFSLALLLVAMAKLTLIDFFALGTGARVIGFTILGSLLTAASFLYQRKKAAVQSFFISPPQK